MKKNRIAVLWIIWFCLIGLCASAQNIPKEYWYLGGGMEWIKAYQSVWYGESFTRKLKEFVEMAVDSSGEVGFTTIGRNFLPGEPIDEYEFIGSAANLVESEHIDTMILRKLWVFELKKADTTLFLYPERHVDSLVLKGLWLELHRLDFKKGLSFRDQFYAEKLLDEWSFILQSDRDLKVVLEGNGDRKVAAKRMRKVLRMLRKRGVSDEAVKMRNVVDDEGEYVVFRRAG